MPLFAEILLPLGNMETNLIFTYQVPLELENKISIGDPVIVPFRNGEAAGYVLGFCPDPGIQTKSILKKNSGWVSLSKEVMNLSEWIAKHYLSSRWSALKGFVFPLDGKVLSEQENHPQVESLSDSKHALSDNAVCLTSEQAAAVNQVCDALGKVSFQGFLLHGVTGSGKTEVYLRCVEKVVSSGRQAVVLVPEIPLSFQVSQKFQEKFGSLVAVLHSKMTQKELRIEKNLIFLGEKKIVIGPRMALFAPVKNLGLIVMDEEHDSSYKQDQNPRYQTFKIAQKLAEQENAVLLLGSATPSLEAYYLTQTENFSLLTLSSRYMDRPLPEIQVVDMREKNIKQRFPFTLRLLDEMEQTLAAGNQVILFLNRRGFSPFVLCMDCGYTFQCPYCSISLTFHIENALLTCHYCSYRIRSPHSCPKCESYSLTYRGFGTQRLEEEIKKYFPRVKVLRLDRDTASKKGEIQRIISSFSKKEVQILIGTQLVAKGFNFPDVSLVGILYADQMFHFPDFRAGEKTFQLLTQVAGRAGRGEAKGKVILQTFDPEHPVIEAVRKQDYLSFYREELETRRRSGYPPFVHIAHFLLEGEQEDKVGKQSEALKNFLSDEFAGDFVFLGPSPAPISKIKKRFRWHFLVKSHRFEDLLPIGEKAYSWHADQKERKIRLIVDVDPVHLL